jgi:hypothetical protein
MDKDTRNAIERATQRARKLLEEDIAAQLEGDFDVHRDGAVAAKAGGHLSARQAFQRERIVAAIEHKLAAGMSAADAARDYLRDAAFTTLNRFVALKMLEARDLVQECITKGEQSAGYREFCGMAPGLPLLPDSAGYRLYIESLFDELSTEVKVLFDRRDPSSVLWPKRATFEQLLEILNATELARVWGEDETIGWVYQFFNGQDERKKMREESQAPRNSRELAVRNQFFTPRYVVQFLTDNTLGRIWYEMRGTKTVLADKCEYMVRKPGEEFVPRAKKDPRDLRVLDPACGSGHFLLYSFDLLLAIYEEAHADPESPKSEATGKALAEDFPSVEDLRKAAPGLVLAHNLHGVDIDPRCAQIAQLALWMRAQRAYRDLGIGRAERAQIRRSNIVVAEPLVADDQLAKEFVAKLGDAELGRVFTSLVESLRLAGDLGLLLRVEQLVARQAKRGQTSALFAPPEERIRAALDRFVQEEARATSTRRRLFADDAAYGVALLSVAEQRFDTVLMNPPFGDSSAAARDYLSEQYGGTWRDLYACFVARTMELVRERRGAVGALLPRTGLFIGSMETYRSEHLQGHLRLLVDLGKDVLDGATVRTACFVIAADSTDHTLVVRVGNINGREERLAEAIRATAAAAVDPDVMEVEHALIRGLPGRAFAYWFPPRLAQAITSCGALSDVLDVRQGIATGDNFRFLRCRWEVSTADDSRYLLYNKGGAPNAFLGDFDLVVRWENDGREMKARAADHYGSASRTIKNEDTFGKPGLTYSQINDAALRFRVHPSDAIYDMKGPVAFPRSTAHFWPMLGVLNSSAVEDFMRMLTDGRQWHPTALKQVPLPMVEELERVGEIARKATAIQARALCTDERSALFAAPNLTPRTTEARVEELLAECDQLVWRAFGATEEETGALATQRTRFLERESDNEALESSSEAGTSAVLSWGFGVAFGRWRVFPSEDAAWSQVSSAIAGIICDVPSLPRSSPAESGTHACDVLVDDEGHPDDAAARIEEHLRPLLSREDIRTWLRRAALDEHLDRYKAAGRTAPVYWQLATPTASYSVWLYIQAFSKDTLFRVQNDYVAPKLAHEERRLESLTSELRDGATAAQRKTLAVQEAVVDELRAFLDEVKRVAPLWKPNLDDGVIINFAPLWRLVPQNKSWQKELKSTWDALCEGKYDWAHLAMHLWPERVVPKCAKDRSQAIAHGLEDVFWVEGMDGKWTARKTATRSVDELVRERTSPAVKSALNSLLEAPTAAGKSGGRRGGGRRKSAAEGGDA